MAKSNDESTKEQTRKVISDFNILDCKFEIAEILQNNPDHEHLVSALKVWLNK